MSWKKMILNIIVVQKKEKKFYSYLDIPFLALVIEACNFSPESFMKQLNTASSG